jgi:hypothetical protein
MDVPDLTDIRQEDSPNLLWSTKQLEQDTKDNHWRD